MQVTTLFLTNDYGGARKVRIIKLILGVEDYKPKNMKELLKLVLYL